MSAGAVNHLDTDEGREDGKKRLHADIEMLFGDDPDLIGYASIDIKSALIAMMMDGVVRLKEGVIERQGSTLDTYHERLIEAGCDPAIIQEAIDGARVRAVETGQKALEADAKDVM